MKRIGICTLYYKNRNYGGNLQAFALQSVISSLGYEAEQISYYYKPQLYKLLSSVKQLLVKKDSAYVGVRIRNKAIDEFNKSIPHSKLYYSNTINSANKQYDCFIAGSDQVWNPSWTNDFLTLGFVNNSKTTAAYAVSTGKINLNETQQGRLRPAVERTRYISLREQDSIPAVQQLTDKKIEWVLDPTLLLSESDWDRLCPPRRIDEKYLFCYFLSANDNLRKTAKEYAQKNNLKIVTLPYLSGSYNKADDNFGDYALYDVSPKDLISLIKYSEFVLTDSFHATVFSHVFGKRFAVAGNREKEMGCRLKSLVQLFGTENRYFEDYSLISCEEIEKADCLPFEINMANYEAIKEKSIGFLKMVLNDD